MAARDAVRTTTTTEENWRLLITGMRETIWTARLLILRWVVQTDFTDFHQSNNDRTYLKLQPRRLKVCPTLYLKVRACESWGGEVMHLKFGRRRRRWLIHHYLTSPLQLQLRLTPVAVGLRRISSIPRPPPFVALFSGWIQCWTVNYLFTFEIAAKWKYI